MTDSVKFHWGRVVVGVIAAEAIPVLMLVVVVVIYGMTAAEGAPSPEEFAPQAGNWVGPIGGFICTTLFACWAARGASSKKLAHGVAVGIGTAALDVTIGTLAGGGDAISAVFVVSNVGRITAGAIGGWLAARNTEAAAPEN